MNQIVVVVFDDEASAEKGRSALRQLAAEESLFVHASAVVARSSERTTVVHHDGPRWAALGTSLGALLGLIGGPVGAAVGALGGLSLGVIRDLDAARLASELVDDIRKALAPGKVAVVAEVAEDSTTGLDRRMAQLGGTVFRLSVEDVRDLADSEDEAAIQAEVARLQAERARASVGWRAKLGERIGQLESELRARQEKARQRRETAERTEQAGIALLSEKADVTRAKSN